MGGWWGVVGGGWWVGGWVGGVWMCGWVAPARHLSSFYSPTGDISSFIGKSSLHSETNNIAVLLSNAKYTRCSNIDIHDVPI